MSATKMVAQWRTASAKNYGILFGIFVPVNAPARQPRDHQRRDVQEGCGTATDQVECRSKSSLRQACRKLRALRHQARLPMLSLGGYGSGWGIRPARAFIRSP